MYTQTRESQHRCFTLAAQPTIWARAILLVPLSYATDVKRTLGTVQLPYFGPLPPFRQQRIEADCAFRHRVSLARTSQVVHLTKRTLVDAGHDPRCRVDAARLERTNA